MKRLLQAMALATAACAHIALSADGGAPKVPSPAVKVSRQLLEQKEAFVKRLLLDSPAARRIEASNNAEAKKFLTAAQESYARAAVSIGKNDLAEADRQLNQATWSIGMARQLVPDPLTRNIEHRVRYAQMLESVESLQISYERHLQRTKEPRRGAARDAALAKVERLLDTAKRMANSEQLISANKALGDAEHALMLALSRVLSTRTLEYTQRFGTPAEEYAYELERNRSYADLIPIALAEFKPGSEAIRQVQYFMDTNRELRDQAQRHAAKKDHRAALAALRGGTTYLQNALAAAGLRVPQDASSQ